MSRARVAGVLFAALLAGAAGCNAIFGIEPPAGGGGAGAGGAGVGGAGAGGGGACPPAKPAACEAAYLDDGDNCCVAGRNCGNAECVAGECESYQITASAGGEEAISIVVSGDRVMWSSGGGRSIYRTDLDGDGFAVLVTPGQHDFDFVTMLAADPDPTGYVFFTDHQGSRIGRVSIEDGQPVVLAEVPAAVAPGAKAGFGRILVHGEHVYWAMDFQATQDGSSHVWRAPREPEGALPVQAELVVQAGGAFGLAGDDQHLYYGDNATQTVKRIAWADIGNPAGEGPQIMAAGQPIGDVAVDDENVYWISYEQVWLVQKDKPNGVLSSYAASDSYLWGVFSDGRDVYFSSVGDSGLIVGGFWRVARDDTGGQPTALYKPEAPMAGEDAKSISAIVHDCDKAYFLVREGGVVRRMTK